MADKVVEFDWIEYSTFILVLVISALIGIYYGFIKGGQDTVTEYLLGSKKMGLFPISMSLTATFTSGISLMGLATEIYTFGTQYMATCFCYLTVAIICAFTFLPVFYELQLISLYEYLELRFNKYVRKSVSFLYVLSLILFIPVVIIGPALALNQGFDMNAISFVVCSICIFYTTFGGLKAVVWTDTLQTIIMYIATIVVAVIGVTKIGGISNVLRIAGEGDRLDFFNFNGGYEESIEIELNMDLDPTLRTTFWTVAVGQTITWSGSQALSPSAVQRFIALDTMKKAQMSVFCFMLGTFVFSMTSAFLGLVIYAQYRGCDPLKSGMIHSADQILPYFILDVIGDVKGLPGLFTAGIVCAALSTMSTGLNTVSGTLYEDFIEPITGKTTEARASMIMKIVSAVFGTICLLMVMIIGKLGSLIELTNAFGGLTTGAALGIFVLGMFFPQANSLGAGIGGLSSLVTMGYILIGSRAAILRGDISYPTKATSVDFCSFNVTTIAPTTPVPSGEDVFPLLRLSIFYYAGLGTIVTIVVGLLVSYISGPNRVEDIDRKLLSPVLRSFLPKYKAVPPKEEELKGINT